MMFVFAETSKGWSVQESRLSNLNTSLLFDGANDTCIDLAGITNVLTMEKNDYLESTFFVRVVLPDHLEKHRRNIIRVLMSDSESGSCPRTVEFKKCLFLKDHLYSCFCLNQCHLSVKIIFLSSWVDAGHSYEVCEIEVMRYLI